MINQILNQSHKFPGQVLEGGSGHSLSLVRNSIMYLLVLLFIFLGHPSSYHQDLMVAGDEAPHLDLLGRVVCLRGVLHLPRGFPLTGLHCTL